MRLSDKDLQAEIKFHEKICKRFAGCPVRVDDKKLAKNEEYHLMNLVALLREKEKRGLV